ncbi:MAG: SCO1664 family protein [Actinobacteria bacterium]|nr:SCO1664 family protein [Actinomycetota bacterium]
MIKNSELLNERELVVIGRLVDASNATLQAKLKDTDPVIKVIYKPIAGERPLWDFQEGNLAHREYAAFLLSDLAGFNLVPQTVLREGPFGYGMVQQWIDIDQAVDVVEFGQSNDLQLRRLALFDAIINNTDRKFGHLLIDKNGLLQACDHGVCFHSEDKLRTVLWQFAGMQLSSEENDLLDRVGNLNLEELLAKLLTEQEIAATRDRIARLKIANKFPNPSDQWPAVPWPPV